MSDYNAIVHVGVTAVDPLDRPARDLLEVLPRYNMPTPGTHVWVRGDGFTQWGEEFPEDDPSEPIHVVVEIARPIGEDGYPNDCTKSYTGEARRAYAVRAREVVGALLDEHSAFDTHFRMVDYVTVDFDPVWGEDSMVIGRWA